MQRTFLPFLYYPIIGLCNESMAMAKASTSSDRSEGCGTEGDHDLLINNILSDDDEIDNQLLYGDLDDIQ